MSCPANVDMLLTPYMKGNEVKWTLTNCLSGEGGGPGSYPPLEVPWSAAPTSPHFTFLINNPPGMAWQFAKDADALWVTTKAQYPTSPSTDWHVPTGSIKTMNPNSGPPNPATDNTQLQFTDINQQQPVKLYYTLNFVNGANSSQKSSTIDPIVDNGGCCKGFTQSSFLSSTSTIDLIIDVAILLILASLAIWLVSRFRSMRNPSQTRTRE